MIATGRDMIAMATPPYKESFPSASPSGFGRIPMVLYDNFYTQSNT